MKVHRGIMFGKRKIFRIPRDNFFNQIRRIADSLRFICFRSFNLPSRATGTGILLLHFKAVSGVGADGIVTAVFPEYRHLPSFLEQPLYLGPHKGRGASDLVVPQIKLLFVLRLDFFRDVQRVDRRSPVYILGYPLAPRASGLDLPIYFSKGLGCEVLLGLYVDVTLR